MESIFVKHGCADFKWIDPQQIVVSQWVRFKCRFGCDSYGDTVCPPNLPSIEVCREFFSEYSEAVLFHFAGKVEKPEDRHEWTRGINGRLLALETEVFLLGYHKAFVLYVDPCNICVECVSDGDDCRYPMSSRPAPESLGVDVFSTARALGFDIEVLTGYDQTMNRFGMLLIE